MITSTQTPSYPTWLQDLLLRKDSISDYCVIGEIDVQALRKFESSHRSPRKPFKPVPNGF